MRTSITQTWIFHSIQSCQSSSNWYKAQVAARVIAFATSFFATIDVVVHILTLIPHVALSTQRCSAFQSHCKRTVELLWLATFGSILGVISPDFLSPPQLRGHGVYILTNETNLDGVRRVLKEKPRPKGETIHIGCAAWYNFDIMWLRKSNNGWIVDINPKTAQFIKKTIELLISQSSRHAFVEAMINYLNSLSGKDRAAFFHKDQRGAPTDRIKEELDRKGSWLQTDKSYQYIKMLAAQHRIIPIIEDITNCDEFAKIRSSLDEKEVTIDTVYMSNLCNFMNTVGRKKAYKKSIQSLLCEDSLLIHCPKALIQEVADLSQFT